VVVMGTGEYCHPAEDFLFDFDYVHKVFIIAVGRLFWYIYSVAIAVKFT
jgi:hypothetical protein